MNGASPKVCVRKGWYMLELAWSAPASGIAAGYEKTTSGSVLWRRYQRVRAIMDFTAGESFA